MTDWRQIEGNCESSLRREFFSVKEKYEELGEKGENSFEEENKGEEVPRPVKGTRFDCCLHISMYIPLIYCYR